MTFSAPQKTKWPTGSPVLFHDFSNPGSDKVNVKSEIFKLAADRLRTLEVM